MQLAVFLDRDNTLIHNDGDLGRAEDVRLMDGVASGLGALRDAGLCLIVVTNQAGVARGKFTEEDVDAVHQRIAALIDEAADRQRVIDRFYYCPYHPEGTVAEYRRDHLWRKPHPGMILQAARDLGIDVAHSWMLGDQERDVQAGQAAGCRTILITRDSDLAQRANATSTVETFAAAVQIILDDRRVMDSAPHPSGDRTEPPISPAQAITPGSQSVNSSSLAATTAVDLSSLRRTVSELADEIRSDRMRRADYTPLKMLAGVGQLLAILFAMLGLLQISSTDAFIKWMIGAILAQLVTLSLLVLGLRQ